MMQSAEKWILNGSAILENSILSCNGSGSAERIVTLDQPCAKPVRISCESAAQNASGNNAYEYSVLTEVFFTDGSDSKLEWYPFNDGTLFHPDYMAFSKGTHDFQLRSMVLAYDKPIASLKVKLLFSNYSGSAQFRNLVIADYAQNDTPLFDTFPCTNAPENGFSISGDKDGIVLETSDAEIGNNAKRHFVKLASDGLTDRVFTLYFVMDSCGDWLNEIDCRMETETVKRDYFSAAPWHVGANGLAAKVPFCAVTDGNALGFDPEYPVFGRVAYNSCFHKLYLAFDIALTPEKNVADFSFVQFKFDPDAGYRGALKQYYSIFSAFYHSRIADQGNWMPFLRIQDLPGWEDFYFKFHEIHWDQEIADWNEAHGITTFRYTEPMTHWMWMGKEIPHTPEHAWEYLLTKADADWREDVKKSVMYDDNGKPIMLFMDRPWCNGAVWSLDTTPGSGDFEHKVTDFGKYCEYLDSIEGYVTADISHRREHFSANPLPLTFSSDTRIPGIWKGSVVFACTNAIRKKLLSVNKYLMANGTPGVMWFVPPLLDVSGTETDWQLQGAWHPMSVAEFRYRRSCCGDKPYCFLMNSDFNTLDAQRVEKYMKRSLVFGMFPGFFSANAATGHYFENPALYERDRPAFKRYLPFIKLVAEAGWDPITDAAADSPVIALERFGKEYLTVLNDSQETVNTAITFKENIVSAEDLLTGKTYPAENNTISLNLNSEDVALLKVRS